MKFLTVFAVLCLVAYSTQSPLFDGCNDRQKQYHHPTKCIAVKCFSFRNETTNINTMAARGCAIPMCEEGQELKGETPGDEAAVYPGCCATPVCE